MGVWSVNSLFKGLMVSDSLHVATQVQTLSLMQCCSSLKTHQHISSTWDHPHIQPPSTRRGEGPPSSKPNDWTRGFSLLQEKLSSLGWGEKSLFSLLMLGRLSSMSQVQHHMRDGEEGGEPAGGDTGDPTRTPGLRGGGATHLWKKPGFPVLMVSP